MLTEEQRTFYRENGYLLVEGLLSREEAGVLREACHALAERLSTHKDIDATLGSAESERKTSLLHCHDVQFYDARFSRLITDERFTEVAAALMETPNLQLHHDKMFIKPPAKGSPFPMHQDQPFFPHDEHSMVAAVFHFDDAPVEKGCIQVVPGSHKLGPLEHNPEGSWHLPFEQYPLNAAVPCPAKAGDVLFFSYLTIHGSGVNGSAEARTTLLVQKRDPADAPSNDEHLSRGQGMMLRGVDETAGVPQTSAMSGMG
ncbi:phytanoyl-CoA dioxygenase family protein [soil metagenome]